jgi:hypothetical protein
MTTRTTRKFVTFEQPFSLADGERRLPAGSYEVITDEELIEGLSFPVYRRVGTMMLVPGRSRQASLEMVSVDPSTLAAAIEGDARATTAPAKRP